MKNSLFRDYSRKYVHFYDEEASILLESGLALVNEVVKKPSIVDLGCGDGRLIFSLYEKGLLKNVGDIVGVDISESRIERLTKELSFVKGIVSDALSVKELPSSRFDFVICSQLIEHVEDDETLVFEIQRLLKSGGLTYVSSVIRKWYGLYFYLRGGAFRLDPTHTREYSSVDKFVDLIAKKGFKVVSVETRQVMFPLLDFAVRLLVRIGFLEPNVRFYQRHKILGKIRRLRIPILGYGIMEVLARKVD